MPWAAPPGVSRSLAQPYHAAALAGEGFEQLQHSGVVDRFADQRARPTTLVQVIVADGNGVGVASARRRTSAAVQGPMPRSDVRWSAPRSTSIAAARVIVRIGLVRHRCGANPTMGSQPNPRDAAVRAGRCQVRVPARRVCAADSATRHASVPTTFCSSTAGTSASLHPVGPTQTHAVGLSLEALHDRVVGDQRVRVNRRRRADRELLDQPRAAGAPRLGVDFAGMCPQAQRPRTVGVCDARQTDPSGS